MIARLPRSAKARRRIMGIARYAAAAANGEVAGEIEHGNKHILREIEAPSWR